MTDGWHRRFKQTWTIAGDRSRHLIAQGRGLLSQAITQARAAVSQQRRRSEQPPAVNATSGYVWAMQRVDIAIDAARIVITVTLPDEPFEHLKVRKIGQVLHIEVEKRQALASVPRDAYAQALARREPRTPPVLRRAIPLQQVTGEPTWHVTDDNRVRVEMRLHGAAHTGRDRVADVELQPSALQPVKARPKREPLQRADDR